MSIILDLMLSLLLHVHVHLGLLCHQLLICGSILLLISEKDALEDLDLLLLWDLRHDDTHLLSEYKELLGKYLLLLSGRLMLLEQLHNFLRNLLLLEAVKSLLR